MNLERPRPSAPRFSSRCRGSSRLGPLPSSVSSLLQDCFGFGPSLIFNRLLVPVADPFSVTLFLCPALMVASGDRAGTQNSLGSKFHLSPRPRTFPSRMIQATMTQWVRDSRSH